MLAKSLKFNPGLSPNEIKESDFGRKWIYSYDPNSRQSVWRLDYAPAMRFEGEAPISTEVDDSQVTTSIDLNDIGILPIN